MKIDQLEQITDEILDHGNAAMYFDQHQNYYNLPNNYVRSVKRLIEVAKAAKYLRDPPQSDFVASIHEEKQVQGKALDKALKEVWPLEE